MLSWVESFTAAASITRTLFFQNVPAGSYGFGPNAAAELRFDGWQTSLALIVFHGEKKRLK